MISPGIIRPALLDDLECIISLEHTCFPGKLAYSKPHLRYLLTKAHRTFLVETSENIIRGFIIILYRKGSRVAGLETIDIDPQYQRQGIAHRLLNAAEAEMKQNNISMIRLEVSPGNHAAISLYTKEGFTPAMLLKNYYLYDHQGSRDAVRMIKELR